MNQLQLLKEEALEAFRDEAVYITPEGTMHIREGYEEFFDALIDRTATVVLDMVAGELPEEEKPERYSQQEVSYCAGWNECRAEIGERAAALRAEIQSNEAV